MRVPLERDVRAMMICQYFFFEIFCRYFPMPEIASGALFCASRRRSPSFDGCRAFIFFTLLPCSCRCSVAAVDAMPFRAAISRYLQAAYACCNMPRSFFERSVLSSCHRMRRSRLRSLLFAATPTSELMPLRHGASFSARFRIIAFIMRVLLYAD